MKLRIIAISSSLVVLLGACAAEPPPPLPDEAVLSLEGEVGSCHWTCPGAPSASGCPHDLAKLVCDAVPCGDGLCSDGNVCCNESCGICAPPGGVCTQQYCGPMHVRNDAGGPCRSDDDCRTFSSYCEGCTCLALSTNQPEPECSGSLVRCFADPCLAQSAFCSDGRCLAGRH